MPLGGRVCLAGSLTKKRGILVVVFVLSSFLHVVSDGFRASDACRCAIEIMYPERGKRERKTEEAFSTLLRKYEHLSSVSTSIPIIKARDDVLVT